MSEKHSPPRAAVAGWEKVVDIILDGNTDTVTFTGLDLEGEGPYMIFVMPITATALNNDMRLFFNGDEVTGNYYVQQFQANNTTIAANRLNEAWISYGDGINKSGFSVLFMGQVPGGYVRTFSLMARPVSPNLSQLANLMHVWTNNTNVTSITFKGRSANCIKTGSRFVILRVV